MFDIREEAIMRPPDGQRSTGIRPTLGVQMIPQSSTRQAREAIGCKNSRFWRSSSSPCLPIVGNAWGVVWGEFRVCRRLPTRCACSTVSLRRDAWHTISATRVSWIAGWPTSAMEAGCVVM